MAAVRIGLRASREADIEPVAPSHQAASGDPKAEAPVWQPSSRLRCAAREQPEQLRGALAEAPLKLCGPLSASRWKRGARARHLASTRRGRGESILPSSLIANLEIGDSGGGNISNPVGPGLLLVPAVAGAALRRAWRR